MTASPAVSVRGLGKRYMRGERQRYRSLREDLSRLLRREPRAERSWNWALRDVSFEVAPGETLGVIGGNGAGKTTLLRILARITEPTCGEAETVGRVGSLLEVGTGFHPELTGRENVWLAGAVMGMTRADVARRFDEIVAFAEVGASLDLPMKRFSTGMQMRLAFAVAAHLEPDILVVDEVLAVGDARFQSRCMTRMGEVASSGRTVLFVSHSMPAVRQLCRRAIWLDAGRVRESGDAGAVVSSYLRHATLAPGHEGLSARIAALPDDPDFQLLGVELGQSGQAVSTVCNGEETVLTVRWRAKRRVSGLRVLADLCDEDQVLLMRTFHDQDADAQPSIEPEVYVSRLIIPAETLASRVYHLRVDATIHGVRYCTPNGVELRFDVQRTGRIGRAYPDQPVYSRLQPATAWSTTAEAAS